MGISYIGKREDVEMFEEGHFGSCLLLVEDGQNETPFEVSSDGLMHHLHFHGE